MTVTARRMRHPVETYGLRLEHAGRILAYSADTDSCEALVEPGVTWQEGPEPPEMALLAHRTF